MLLTSAALDIGVLARNAAAETICAEDMAAMLWTTHSRVPWSYHAHHRQCLQINDSLTAYSTPALYDS